MWAWGSVPLFALTKRSSHDAYDSRVPFWGLPNALGQVPCGAGVAKECYLVDPASSHMLVSKIKPCMSKYARLVQ